jgi:hypothetical protein
MEEDLERQILGNFALEDYFTLQDLAALLWPTAQWRALSTSERRDVSLLYDVFIRVDRSRHNQIRENIRAFCAQQKQQDEALTGSSVDGSYDRAAGVIVESLAVRTAMFEKNTATLLDTMNSIAEAVGRVDGSVPEFGHEVYDGARDGLDRLLAKLGSGS